MAKYIFLTRMFVDMSVQVEQDFNKWYWEEHIPAMTSVPGVLSGRRYRTVGNAHPDAPQYMAIYELERPEVVQSYGWHINSEGSEWAKRLSLHFQGTPGVYERIFPEDVDDSASYPTAEYLYVTRMTPTEGGEKDFNNWYNQYHIPEMTGCPGVISGRRFASVGSQHAYTPKYLAIYELENPGVPESAAWRAAGFNQRAIDIMTRTRILKSVPGVYQLLQRPG